MISFLWRSLVLAACAMLAAPPVTAAADPASSWNGFYVGAHAGYAWTRADINTTLGPAASCGGGVVNCNAVSSVESQPLNPRGFAGGALAGYSFQSGSLVYGLEADFSGLAGSASRTVTGTFPVGGCCFTVSQSVKADWTMTIRPRIGYAFDRALVYATGGLALGHLKYSEQVVDTAGNTENTNISSVKAGWTLGGGVEYALPNRWTLRGEYLYTKFAQLGTDTTASVVSYVPPSPLVYSHRVDFSSSTARAALIYRLQP